MKERKIREMDCFVYQESVVGVSSSLSLPNTGGYIFLYHIQDLGIIAKELFPPRNFTVS